MTGTATNNLDARREHERSKYVELASRTNSSYGASNHGRDAITIVKRWKPRLVMDFGCGRNDFITELRRHGIDGLGVDFAFPEADVNKPMHETKLVEGVADVVTSFDALEHVLTEDVVPVLNEMRRVARPRAWFCFSICTRPSRITVAGENLHPTVRPLAWWVDVIGRVGMVNDTRAGGRYVTGRFK
ncbi:MAG: methyltransferase domain-containing protein [Planctomycetota bacterium]